MYLVTGGSRGIGKEIVLQLVQKGFHVFFCYATADGEGEARATKEETGSMSDFRQCRLEDSEDCRSWFQSGVAWAEKLGLKIEALVNNAGVSLDVDDPLGVSYEEYQRMWETTLAVNVRGPANLAFLYANHLRSTKSGGRIVCMSSRASFCGDVSAPWYGASKAAMDKAMQALAITYARENILFFSVAPGATDTAMWGVLLTPEQRAAMDARHPLRRIARVDEVASIVVYAATTAPAIMTGGVIDCNGAMAIH
jgi:3-oxoacyl-[acyl-carrier protein] reductase